MNESIALNKALAELDGEKLSQLYQRVFNTDSGQLVLQDLKNRAYFSIPYIADNDTETDKGILGKRDGMRAIVLTIEARLLPVEPQADTGAEE